jgi:hypothetical protein
MLNAPLSASMVADMYVFKESMTRLIEESDGKRLMPTVMYPLALDEGGEHIGVTGISLHNFKSMTEEQQKVEMAEIGYNIGARTSVYPSSFCFLTEALVSTDNNNKTKYHLGVNNNNEKKLVMDVCFLKEVARSVIIMDLCTGKEETELVKPLSVKMVETSANSDFPFYYLVKAFAATNILKQVNADHSIISKNDFELIINPGKLKLLEVMVKQIEKEHLGKKSGERQDGGYSVN